MSMHFRCDVCGRENFCEAWFSYRPEGVEPCGNAVAHPTAADPMPDDGIEFRKALCLGCTKKVRAQLCGQKHK
jgi:hypothetical protein